ncbi:MAG: hypothetical protein D6800_07400, partial [Candidatus Zixiibacteriota bacterium]
MSLSGSFKAKLVAAAMMVGLSLPAARANGVSIAIVYPKPGQVVGAVDSTFILGHLSDSTITDFSDFDVRVNELPARLHRDGGFIAFVPIQPGEFTFRVTARRTGRYRQASVAGSSAAVTELTVTVPRPLATLPTDSLQIVGGYGEPRGDVVLRSGDRLDIMFRGTPGMRAWASLPGVADSIPMAETTPRPQPYWGEAVFGAGKIPDSVLVRGIYSGFVIIPDSARVADAHLQYHLAPPDRAAVTATLLSGVDSVRQRQFLWNCLFMDTLRSATSAYAISINPPDYPFTVRFTDSVQTIRYGPRKGYFAIFQPAGVEALVVGKEAKWYRAQLSQTHYAWIFEEAVER